MGNNYTETIANDNTSKPRLTAKDLSKLSYGFNTPFEIDLPEEQIFYADEVVRFLPKKRLVAFGTWQDKSVVAKLFFDPHHAKRHLEEELAGVKLLQENKVPTPGVYYQGMSADGRIQILFFQRVFSAKNLEDVWVNNEDTEEVIRILKATTIELATQHVLGLLQHDLHFKNFLWDGKKILTLDGAEIEALPFLLPKKNSMENLALFLAHLGVGCEVLQDRLFKYYAKSRGWLLKDIDSDELFFSIQKHNEARWQQFQKKIFRDCSAFARVDTWNTFGMYDRQYTGPELLEFLKHPDEIFTHPKNKMLKEGRSSTVIKLKMDGREYVIKRYNLKNMWHRLRRCLRKTRAQTSWRLAQKLNLFGATTAKPVAFIEKKFLGFNGKSYYVTEYVPGAHVTDYFAGRHSEATINEMVKRIMLLLRNIAKLEITHGDLKATNILISKHGKPVFIDLDGAKEHRSISSLRNAWRKEIARFLRNFDDLPKIKNLFEEEFNAKKLG